MILEVLILTSICSLKSFFPDCVVRAKKKDLIESCCLYRDYSYTENLSIPRVFSRENHVLDILQELSLTISQKKLVQENRTKLFSPQKAELGLLLAQTP